MKILLNETPFYLMIDCCKKFKDSELSNSHQIKKLIVKDGKIICPNCKKPLNGELFLEL